MLLLWVLAVLGLIFIIYQIQEFTKTWIMMKNIPGPKAYPLLGNLLDIAIPSDKLWILLRRLSMEYYPVYRMWSGPFVGVTLIEPEDVEVLMGTTKHIKKSRLYELLEPWLGTGLLTSTGKKWQSRRKILTPAFHFSILQQFIPIFTEHSQFLVNRLKLECDKSHSDLVPLITKFTLHSICETAMGVRLADSKSQEPYATSIYRLGEIVVKRVLTPWNYWNWIYMFTPEFWEEISVTKYLHSFSSLVIGDRKLNIQDTDSIIAQHDDVAPKKRLAMLDLLISAQKNGIDIDDEGIREEVDTFMFEGHDTTSMCISFTLFLLANHQNIQDRVLEEQVEIFGNSDRSATYQDLQSMNYLELVIKESLRMYPSVPLIARSTEEPLHTKSGYVIPENVDIIVYIYDLHHNPKVFPNPKVFDPDRFLPEECQKRHPFAYIPFSAGPRNCIGQKFAMLEIKAVLSSIIRNFKLIAVDKPEDLVMVMDIIIRTKNGIKIKFESRKV